MNAGTVQSCADGQNWGRPCRVGLWLWMVAAVFTGHAANYQPSDLLPPPPLREFRGAWIAAVGNLDWPSKPGLSSAQQKSELLALLDRAAQLKLNTIIFQVRPACDALYASSLEPWSEYLTGTMGQAPQPPYDPLAFAIEAAHRRGLELHAWFNPFRAHHPSGKSPLAPNHVSNRHPQFVHAYGKQMWLDPGAKDAQDYSLAVIMDVVHRYDIDGVHFDDYFYPYPEKDRFGKDLAFPDETSWQRFGAGRGLTREDWRRENVNGFVHRSYESIKAAKPWVKFGISPFGIWRPANPPDVRGFDAYANLYADSRLWLAKGWVDYFAPQLYWSIHSPQQNFASLLKWWAAQNPQRRHLVAGIETTKTGHEWRPEELLSQIRLTRQQSGVAGHIHWEMKALMEKNVLTATLQKDIYALPALVLASPWLGGARPEKPTLILGTTERTGADLQPEFQGLESATWSGTSANDEPGLLAVVAPGPGLTIRWHANGTTRPCLWVLQTRVVGAWQTEVLPATQNGRRWARLLPDVIALSAIDRNGNASPPSVIQRVKR